MAMMMDSQQHEQPMAQLSSTYPPAPMEYVNMYTNENVKSGKAPPPPKIIKDSYTSFGKPIDPNDVLIRSLESQGLQQLYSLAQSATSSAASGSVATSGAETTTRTYINTNNHKRELKKLNHSILIAYLDLLEILVKAPNTQIEIEQPAPIQHNELGEPIANPEPIIIIKTLREQKLQDIELLFINMHHLINELRPHQARDNIRCILEMQKQQRIEIAQKFKAHLFKIVDLLKSCIQSIQPSSNQAKSKIFLDELNSLITSANQISKSLDKFSNKNTNHQNNTNSQQSTTTTTKTNGFVHHDLDENENDIEMKSNSSELYDEQQQQQNNLLEVVNNTQNKLNKLTFNEQRQKYCLNSSNDNNNNNNNNAKNTDSELLNNKNCDIKDLILCDLIDEFLIKENEF